MVPDITIAPRDLEDFVGVSSDWFWETDHDHRFTYVSPQLVEHRKVQVDQFLGRSRLEVAQADPSSPGWVAHIEDLKSQAPFRNFKYHVTCADGAIMWIRTSGDPFFDQSGTFVGYRGTAHDITDEKLAMARLQASNAALQMRNRELDAARQALERSVYEDTLTEVWNRRAFERDLQDMLACKDRNPGLLHIDLDRFKLVNDTLGHPAGDIVLKAAAARIRRATGTLGTAYRVGGDEFKVILCDDMSQEMAVNLGHKIIDAMSAQIPLGRSAVRVGASIGVAVANGAEVSAQCLISQADAALYDAKSKGRNSVRATTKSLGRRIEEHRWIAADLPLAIEREELVPYFQPQMNLQTGEIIGVEALVRWPHPKRGLVHPPDFLGVAAELALCDEIDRIMLKKGLAAVDRLAAMGLQLPSLSVNTSQARLLDPRLISDIGCLWTNPHCSLSLELLETIDFENCCDHIQLRHNLERLRSIGVRIETDDFGSARASITSLLQVSPHRLKIDQRLIKDMIANLDKRSIVRAILDLAQSLKIECLAEGVEDHVVMDMLHNMGCLQAQGHAIAPAMHENELAIFLRAKAIAEPTTPLAWQRKTAGPLSLPQTA